MAVFETVCIAADNKIKQEGLHVHSDTIQNLNEKNSTCFNFYKERHEVGQPATGNVKIRTVIGAVGAI